jgi:alkylhydroperoxidase family enzyme
MALMTLTLLLLVALSFASTARADPPRTGSLADPLSNDEAWRRLPPPVAGSGQPLPIWARMLAGELPRTTAAFLELDHAHRARSPVDPKLRAAMRWVAAHANRCAYAEACAAADARGAGLDAARIDALVLDDYPGWSGSERAALRFARKMTLDSDSVSDEEFAGLVKSFGEKQTASMVLLLAYANFQDRVLLCLGATIEPGGPLPPVEVSFAPASFETKTTPPPPRLESPLPRPAGKDLVEDDLEWAALSYDALQDRLEVQRRKPTRLRIPSWDELSGNLPAGLFTKPSDIVWYRIVFGYAPELAVPYEYLMRTAGAEAAPNYDRVFGSSVFWVTTKAIRCPYCMGHCEMNWEVAGLTKDEIAERSRLLAGADWSSFPPAEQHAYAFARKLTTAPWSITDDDMALLKRDCGADRAIIMLNASRYHYMTRISNGFQLRLERENVFYDYYNTRPPELAGAGAVTCPGGGPVAVLTDEECWKRMPPAATGGGQPLPNWAKAVATRLPRTAAAMLALDRAQRTKTPLDPVLRARMRWVIAHANRCAYSEAYALADLKRAGGDEASIQALARGPEGWLASDREPLELARLLTQGAPSIPDELFVRLRYRFGDRAVAAMVLLGAYGNFQDRVVLGLGLPLEPGGPLHPLDVAFAPGAFQAVPILPPQGGLPRLLSAGATVVERDPHWSEVSYEALQSRLDRQRSRAPRLPIPSWDAVKPGLPPALASRPTRIVWNLVCSGYVPELAVPWSVATRTMWAEAGQDRVFEESLFWVQARAVECSYCMGHCEMLLEVAGLDKGAVAERTRRLASDDWSAFPPAEQRAYAYARKLSKTPWELTAADYRALQSDLGPDKAMAAFWWLCRGLYMTRVSDGFQLPLERDNVFAEFYRKGSFDVSAK